MTPLALAAATGHAGDPRSGGVTLPPTAGEDAGKVQTIGARYAQGELSLQEAADWAAEPAPHRAAGLHPSGMAATSQVVAEALGLSLLHSAFAPLRPADSA